MLVVYLPHFIDLPAATYPEMKDILVGEKVHEGNSLYTVVIDATAPFAGWCNGVIDMIAGRSLGVRHAFSFIIIFLQAAFLAILFIDKKAYAETSFIPAAIYVVLCFFSYDTLALSPELLGAGVLLLALNALCKEIEFREQRNEGVFSLGLFIGIASLFVFSYIVFLLAALVILNIYTRNAARKYILMVVGFLLPHLLLLGVYYLKDGLEEVWVYFYVPNLRFAATRYLSFGSLLVLGAVPLLYLLVSMFMLNREARFSKYQSQLVQAMFFWMVFAVLQILYAKDFRPQSCITLFPCFSFFITHFFLLIRRRTLAELNFWILLVGTVATGYLARYDMLGGVEDDRLTVKDDRYRQTPQQVKVMALAEDLSVYQQRAVATPFLQWSLCEPIFLQPDVYQHVLRVNNALVREMPDVIVDPKGLMRPFMERLPGIRRQYRPSTEGYRRISN